jgi:hypothetical protein
LTNNFKTLIWFVRKPFCTSAEDFSTSCKLLLPGVEEEPLQLEIIDMKSSLLKEHYDDGGIMKN